jgi:hypothetical protein
MAKIIVRILVYVALAAIATTGLMMSGVSYLSFSVAKSKAYDYCQSYIPDGSLGDNSEDAVLSVRDSAWPLSVDCAWTFDGETVITPLIEDYYGVNLYGGLVVMVLAMVILFVIGMRAPPHRSKSAT